MTTPTLQRAAILLLMVLLVPIAGSVAAQEPMRLTAQDVRRLAVEYNRDYLRAREDVTKAGTDVTRARADALPQVSLDAYYNRSFKVPRVFFVANGETVELQTGFKNSYGATISARQSLWHGGRVFTALKIARLYEQYSSSIADQVEAAVILGAEQLFHAAILSRAQLAVQKKALAANTANLEVVEKKYSQGMVSEFEVLRSRVERQNILPRMIRAESEVELAEKRLKSFLGLELDQPLLLVENQADTSLAGLPTMDVLTDSALVQRPEVTEAERLERITRKAISIARSNYWPSLDAVGAVDWQAASDDFTLKKNNSTSWTAGLTLSLNIFDGFKRRGEVTAARADHNRARLAAAQMRDDVRLEVEEAYTRLMQAKKALDIQSATIAAAEEGLRIAQVRYESGVGTQLEVLSAQTALTEAREQEAQATYAFRVARAELKKATTVQW